MIERIYSRVKHDKLLHIVYRKDDAAQRIDICEPAEFLQVASMTLPQGKMFKKHKHKWKAVDNLAMTQETWIVLSGKIKVIYYDLDDEAIHSTVLNPGDCTITFYGGHSYQVAEGPAEVFEAKSGPYTDPDTDKEYI